MSFRAVFPRCLRLLGAAGVLMASHAYAADSSVLMSPSWAGQFCQAWNQNTGLTQGLAGEWLHDDKGRGYKIVQMYRDDCGAASRVELKIVPQDGQAHCAYGGAPKFPADFAVDFMMHASTANWEAMGHGDPGPMWAMMSGKLQFQGPRLVAMRSIKPFTSFLLMIDKVQASSATCPAAAKTAS